MPEPAEHLDPKEATEAKLCAYLEGELAPAERAEIEQHLSANPQHRQLLADLAKTREWMQMIPRELVPVDLGELFEGQMERSMLLDAQSPKTSMGRWPQYAMVAAILVLTLGLGATLFLMLSGTGGRGKSLSLGPTTSRIAATAPVTESFAASAVDKAKLAMPLKSVMDEADAGLKQPAAGAALSDRDDARRVADMSKKVSTPAVDPFSAAVVTAKLQTLGYHLPADQKVVGFVISTAEPINADVQVRNFFDRHDLAFDDVQTGKHFSRSAAVIALATTLPTTQATTQNYFAKAMPLQQQENQRQTAANSLTQLAANAPVANNQQPTAPLADTVYVAHGLSQLQVELLNASLSADNAEQTVHRLKLSDAGTNANQEKPVSPLPATGPVSGIIKGQILTITVAQLVGPGIEKTNVVKVGDDGTISLPMIDPLPAGGQSPSDLQAKIAAKYREANLIPQADVTVVPVMIATTNPTTAPTSAPTTQLMARVFASSQPTTQTAKDDTAKPVTASDVIVWIQKSDGVTPAQH